MTSYTAITDASINQDSPLTEDLLTLLRDNPIAGFEGATDAPVNAAAWHPYDMTLVGDGGDGEFYDFATDGASASIETPAFADGYEYAIHLEDYSTTANATVSIEVQSASSAAWVALTSSSVSGPSSYRGLFAINTPRLVTYAHSGQWLAPLHTNSGSIVAEGMDAVSTGTTASALSKARVSVSLGTSDGGKLYLLRRREFVTG